MAGIVHRSYSGLPETLSPPFSPLCPWIHGLFPAIEFVVAPSSSLPNSGDPGATLARARLNSGDLTTVERSGAARSRLFPRSDFPRPILIEWLGPRLPLRARLFPRSDFPRPILIERLGPRLPLRARMFPRSDFPYPILIERLKPPRTPSILIEWPRPQDTALRPHALTPWPACQRPCPLALGPLGQCALPLCH
jgi:hypothetical protein